MRLLIFSFLWIFLSFPVSMQPASCAAVLPVSEIMVAPAAGGESCRLSQTVASGSLLFTATTAGLLVLDPNAGESALLSCCQPPPDSLVYHMGAPSVEAVDSWVYFSYGDRKLWTIDATDPINPNAIYYFDTRQSVETCERFGNLVVIVEDGLILEFMDVADPSRPAMKSHLQLDEMYTGDMLHPSFINDVEKFGDYLYVVARHLSDSGGDYGQLYVYDISDITAPSKINMFQITSPDVTFGGMPRKDKYGYLDTEFDTIILIDLSDPADLSAVTTIERQGSAMVHGDRLYFKQFFDTLIYDIENPFEPVYLGSKWTFGYSHTVDLDIVDGRLIATNSYEGIVDFGTETEDRTDPLFMNALALDICADGDMVYLANCHGGVAAYDVRDPSNPMLADVINTQGKALSLDTWDSTLYVCLDWEGIEIVDISDPSNLTGTMIDPGPWQYNHRDVLVRDGLAYVSGREGFLVLDLAAPWEPEILVDLSAKTWYSHIIGDVMGLNDTYAFLSSSPTPAVVDISDPTAAQYLGRMPDIPLPAYSGGLLEGNVLYGIDVEGRLTAMDVTSPFSPEVYPDESKTYGSYVDGAVVDDYLFLSDGDLHVFDITEPLSPKHVCSRATDGDTGRISLNPPYIYTADQQFFRVYYFDETVGVADGGDYSPPVFTLDDPRPNPFNPSTSITFSLGKTGQVRLNVYNILGQNVAMLADGVLSAGSHIVHWDASGSAAGTYIITLECRGRRLSRKVMLVR